MNLKLIHDFMKYLMYVFVSNYVLIIEQLLFYKNMEFLKIKKFFIVIQVLKMVLNDIFKIKKFLLNVEFST
jgi:hypothetical protein